MYLDVTNVIYFVVIHCIFFIILGRPRSDPSQDEIDVLTGPTAFVGFF